MSIGLGRGAWLKHSLVPFRANLQPGISEQGSIKPDCRPVAEISIGVFGPFQRFLSGPGSSQAEACPA